MQFLTKNLIKELCANVSTQLQQVSEMADLPSEILKARKNEQSWNIIQVLEHLNSYCDWYLPRITDKLKQADAQTTLYFNSGWLGDYFIDMMRPDPENEAAKKYKAAKKHSPDIRLNSSLVIVDFIENQHQMLDVLQMARTYNLNSIRVPISIQPLVTLKLGDIFRFLIIHQQRHFVQIDRIKDELVDIYSIRRSI